jgi:hypothetical protein
MTLPNVTGKSFIPWILRARNPVALNNALFDLKAEESKWSPCESSKSQMNTDITKKVADAA